MDWNDEDVALLKQMHSDGVCFREIGLALGITRNAVAGKVWRLKLPLRAKSRPRPKKRVRKRPPMSWGKRMETPVKNEPTKPEVAAKPVGIFDIRDEQCRFPIEGIGIKILFCGAPRVPSYPYCTGHCAVAYHRPVPRSRGELEKLCRTMKNTNDKLWNA